MKRDKEWYRPGFSHSPQSSSPAGTGKTDEGDSLRDMLEVVAILSGIVLVAVGLYLFAGNVSGLHPTFAYAGFFTTSLGFILIAAGVGRKEKQSFQHRR